MLQPIIENIPTELQQLTQWVVWKAKPKANGKTDKIPHDPNTGRKSDSTNPDKWGTFNQATKAYSNGGGYTGIGFVLADGGHYVGVDLDSCTNPETGAIEKWAWEIVEQLNTYTEISPSGTGLRLILKGELPPKGRKKDKVEVYCDKRFLTITGHHVKGTPTEIMERQHEIIEFHESVFGGQKPLASKQPSAHQGGLLSDGDIITRATTGTDALLGKLWAGDISGYKSHSEADQALCNKLAFYTGKDPEQMDRLFRQSGLYRKKWDRDDYRADTIETAIDGTSEVYTGGRVSAEDAFGQPLNWDGTPEQEPVDQADVEKKPTIRANNRFLDDMGKQALDALVKNNYPPKLYIRGGKIVRLLKIQDKDNKNQTFYRPTIELINEHTLRGYLARSANFVNVREKKGELVTLPTMPPMDVVREIMSQGNLPFPLLRNIVQVPILRYDGSLFDTPGYDTVSSLYYEPQLGFTMPGIPERPTKEDARSAVNLLKDVVCDFPFDSEASKANVLAAIITPVLRDFIAGPVPLLLVDKPLQGTGATLLTNVVSVMATGENAYITTAPDGKGREEEWRKRITSILLEGRLITVIDNVEEVLRSAALCALLTAEKWKDRILGTNSNAHLDNTTCWIATGNNIRLAGDMPRRCYLVRLDAETAKPWERDTKGFKYQDLLQHVKKSRGVLLASIYTIARAWIQAGRPVATNAPIMGSFEQWRNTIGGMLEFAGVDGFLDNNALVHDNAEVNEGLEPFIQAWHETFGTKGVTTREIKQQLTGTFQYSSNKLLDALPDWLDPYDRGFTRKLGWVLAKKAGVIFTNGYKLEKDGTHRRAQKWRVDATV